MVEAAERSAMGFIREGIQTGDYTRKIVRYFVCGFLSDGKNLAIRRFSSTRDVLQNQLHFYRLPGPDGVVGTPASGLLEDRRPRRAPRRSTSAATRPSRIQRRKTRAIGSASRLSALDSRCSTPLRLSFPPTCRRHCGASAERHCTASHPARASLPDAGFRRRAGGRSCPPNADWPRDDRAKPRAPASSP